MTVRTTACLAAAGLVLSLSSSAFAQAQLPTPTDPQPGTGPQVSVYDAGDAIIEQPSLRDTDFFEMPIPIRGVLAVPSGAGPFPVAVFVHGSYPFCDAPLINDDPEPYPCPAEHDQRQFEGFAELAAGLASRGYLTIVPDMAPEYANGFGVIGFGDRAIEIIDAHLDALVDGTAMPVDVSGKADLERLVIAGHSRGGPLAVRYLTDQQAERAPVALALVTPAYIESVPEAIVPVAMSTALVVAECDGDVGSDQPLLFLSRQLEPGRSGLTVVYTIEGGTHNAVSTRLDRDQATACTADQLLDPAHQRMRATTFLADFFDMALPLI